MTETTSERLETWKRYECNRSAMTMIPFGPDRVLVAPETVDAWKALESVFKAHQYDIRVKDTDSYCCREIKGGGGKSLHSCGIALDVNWTTNPFKMTPDRRAVHYSTKPTQAEREGDVKLGMADTDMTPEMIKDVCAIKTKAGKTLFQWGGDWHDRKDAMHFELDVSPSELQPGVDWTTVKKPTVEIVDADERGGVLSDIDAPAAAPIRGDVSIPARDWNAELSNANAVFVGVTRDAIIAFQAVNSLPLTGVLDDATIRAISSALQSVKTGGLKAMKPEDILRLLLGVLSKQTIAPAAPPAQGGLTTQDILQQVVAAVVGKQSAGGTLSLPAPDTLGFGAVPAILSPIDKVLGGESMVGGKTAIAVVAYAILSILQSVDAVGTATGPDMTTTGQILTTLIAGFGSLGFLSKIDRLIKSVGLLAVKAAAVPK